MSFADDLFNRALGPIFEKLRAALGPFGKLFDLIKRFFTGITDTVEKSKELALEIFDEIGEWRNFKEQIPVKNGVISLPKAIEQSQALLEEIAAAWRAIVDLGRQIKDQLNVKDPAADAEEALADIQSSGIKNILERFPKLAKGLEKILGFLALVVGALESIGSAIDDIKAIVDAIRDIREEIESGTTIFLSQKNPRKTVKLEDGSSFKIRVGNLHSAE